MLQTISELEGESDLMEMLSPLKTPPLQPYFWLETDYYQGTSCDLFKGVTSRTLRTFSLSTKCSKVIIVSATIDVGPDVDVSDLLGLKQVRKVNLPMDTLPNQAIWIDQSMPMIGVSSEEEYEVALAKRLQKLSEMEYPILVLFTSSKEYDGCFWIYWIIGKCVTQLKRKNGTAFNVKKTF